MATPQDVRQYLAYWFQAGKRIIANGTPHCPASVIAGDRYSDDFEQTWQMALSQKESCYLDGTDQTIADLLGDSWDIASCARCSMPVPIVAVGISALECPCNDLPTWPNFELPQPRSPVSSTDQLNRLRDRLR